MIHRPRIARNRTLLACLVGLFAFSLALSCGGDSDDASGRRTPVPSGSPTPGISAGGPYDAPTVEATQLKVVLINVMSPAALDPNDVQAAETYDDRLNGLIEDLKLLDADIIAVNEMTVTSKHGNTGEKLAKGLKMDWAPWRANPWFPGQTKEASAEIARQIDFEEGDCILSRYPILRYEGKGGDGALNPRVSDFERRSAMHVVINGPGSMGEIDLYLTHLTGGGERVRELQTQDMLNWIQLSRGTGPVLVFGDLSEPVGSPAYNVLAGGGFQDALAGNSEALTCCRTGVVGEQPAATIRTDHIFVARWAVGESGLLGDAPIKRSDGSLLYFSDHNGVYVVLPIPPPAGS